MRSVIQTSRFKKSFKKVLHYNGFDIENFNNVIVFLASDLPLADKHKDHSLRGEFKGFRECHISPDILLIYYKDKEKLILELIDIGSHSNLF